MRRSTVAAAAAALYLAVKVSVVVDAQVTDCDGCQDCTADILNNDANGETCQTRINALIAGGTAEREACARVAQSYPLACGPQW